VPRGSSKMIWPVGAIVPQAVPTKQSRARKNEGLHDNFRTECCGEGGIGGSELNTDDRSLPAGRGRVAGRARKAQSEVRSSGFEVPKTSNLGPRTLPRLAHLARPTLPPGRATQA